MQELWDTHVERFARVTDTLGKPIDSEIFELVVALNVLNISTMMSCGGHIDDGRGLLLPWVDIEPADPRLPDLKQTEQQLLYATKALHQKIVLMREEREQGTALQETQRRVRETSERLREVQWQIRGLQAPLRVHLAEYLTLFYVERLVPFDRRLILSGLEHTRLHNQGYLDFHLQAPVAVQQMKLLEYREEMAAFATFLKHCYFSQHPLSR